MMALKATCRNNPEHKTFHTTAHVLQEWVVDETGEFIEMVEDLEVVHWPCRGNMWSCATCGQEAKVEAVDNERKQR